jgi:hypothetical protein
MPEPTSTAATTLAASTVAVPVLAAFGISLGLRADMLLAGFGGGIAAIAFLNAVPSTGDTWRELVRTTARRVGFCFASALFAAYTAPLFLIFNGIREEAVLGIAFVAGSGASLLLPWLIDRMKGGKGEKPAEKPELPPAPGGGAA